MDVLEDSPLARPLPLTLLAWRPVRRNTLRGFAHVQLGRALAIKDVAVHWGCDRTWVSLPGRPVLDPAGYHMRGNNGRLVYLPILEWTDPVTAKRFAEGVIEMIDRDHPGQLVA